MTSQCTAQLLADLGVTRCVEPASGVTRTTTFSEAQFKTLKWASRFP